MEFSDLNLAEGLFLIILEALCIWIATVPFLLSSKRKHVRTNAIINLFFSFVTSLMLIFLAVVLVVNSLSEEREGAPRSVIKVTEYDIVQDYLIAQRKNETNHEDFIDPILNRLDRENLLMFLASIFIFHYLFLIKGGILTRHSFAHYLERATTFPMKHTAGILLGLIAILVPLSIAKVNGF